MSPVFGMVRFSYVPEESGGFDKTRGKPYAARERIVMDPQRLERRFQLFQAICLPSLAAQPVCRFTGIVLTSDSLPEPFAARLRDLVAPYPNIHAVFDRPKLTRQAMADAVRARAPSEGIKLTFRLDDDDAVAADFTRYIERYRRPGYDGHCVSLYRGLGLCRIYGRTRAWERQRYMVSAGLAFVNAAQAPETIYDCGNHERVGERFPTVVDATRHAYLQSSHGMNDSGSRVPLAARVWPKASLSLDAARARYGAQFPFLAASDFGFL